jgi:hypothetical protein
MSEGKTLTVLGYLERANLNHWDHGSNFRNFVFSNYSEYRTTDKVQILSHSD